MRKIVLLVIGVMLSVMTFAQIGLGLTEQKVATFKKVDGNIVAKKLTDSTSIIRITGDNYSKGYAFVNGVCILYVVYPLNTNACDTFLEVCNSKFTYLGNEKWTTFANGMNIIITRLMDDELKEHVYLFEKDE
jgi:hypothetical protein